MISADGVVLPGSPPQRDPQAAPTDYDHDEDGEDIAGM